MVGKIISDVIEYCCFNDEALPRFNFIQHGQHALSYALVQVTVNASLIRVKLLLAINRNPVSYRYSCLCECSLIAGATNGDGAALITHIPSIFCTTIQPNTNTLFGRLFRLNRIFGTTLNTTEEMIEQIKKQTR